MSTYCKKHELYFEDGDCHLCKHDLSESRFSDLLAAIRRIEFDLRDGGTIFHACLAYAEKYGGSTAATVNLIKLRETVEKIKNLRS